MIRAVDLNTIDFHLSSRIRVLDKSYRAINPPSRILNNILCVQLIGRFNSEVFLTSFTRWLWCRVKEDYGDSNTDVVGEMNPIGCR